MSEEKLNRYKSKQSKDLYRIPSHSHKNNSLLKELDDMEIYEWGHLKLLKVNRFLKKKKYEEVIEFLKEIVQGIESKTWETNEFSIRIKGRILEEIELPALKKLRNLFINNRNYQEAFEVSGKVFFYMGFWKFSL